MLNIPELVINFSNIIWLLNKPLNSKKFLEGLKPQKECILASNENKKPSLAEFCKYHLNLLS